VIVYVDACVIVRALSPAEADWQRCAELLAGDHTLITAHWSVVECSSTFRRTMRQRPPAETDSALAALQRVLDAFTFASPPMLQLMDGALNLVRRHRLKTLDAMHLAAAVSAVDLADLTGFGFATVDGELASAALEEGLGWPR